MFFLVLLGLVLSASAKVLPSAPQCGQSKVDRLESLQGDPTQGEWPWAAAIGYQRGNDSEIKWMSGATIISDRYLLTAAVPLSNSRFKPVMVHVGDVDFKKGIQVKIQSLIAHENFSNNFKVSTPDIGLIKLETPLQFSDNVAPICLPSAAELLNKDFINTQGVVVGWGLTSFGGSIPDKQKSVLVKVSDFNKCKEAYARPRAKVELGNNQMCAASGIDGYDACQGFSGSALATSVNEAYYAIGITSFGKGCGIIDYPTIYTKVGSYMDWIQKNID